MGTTAIPLPPDATLDPSPAAGVTLATAALTPDQHPPVSFDPNATFSQRPSLSFDEIPGHVAHLKRAPQPSLYQRLHDVVAEAVPRYSSKTVYDPTYGQPQLAAPEKFLTPEERRQHPMATGFLEAA